MTDKQQAFADHYTDPTSPGFGNASRSAELAGYSKNSARQQGSALLSNPAIMAAIAQRRKQAGEDAAFSRAQAIHDLREMASSWKLSVENPRPSRVELEALELACRIAGHIEADGKDAVGAGVYAYIGTPPPGVVSPAARSAIEDRPLMQGRSRVGHPTAVLPSRRVCLEGLDPLRQPKSNGS